MMYNNDMGKKQTPYGLDRYRRPYFKGDFRYPQGIKPEAVILDIDGTWLDWGNKVNPTTLAWVKKHHKAKRTIIVITARVQEWEYQSSWDMLAHTLPCAFVGPICRSDTDPRYACEFKRETMEALSNIYHIVGAADDAPDVNTMLRWWAKEYFEDPADFDHLVTDYSPYKDWRKDLPSKAGSRSSAKSQNYPTTITSNPHYGVGGTNGGTHRAAGTRDFTPWWEDTHKDPWYDQAAKGLPILDAEVIR
jgi:hypothetical protein